MTEPSQAFLLDRFEDCGNTVRNRKTGKMLVSKMEYPLIRVGPSWEPKVLLHRVLWIMRNRPIPAGMVVDHVDGDPHSRTKLRLCTLANNQWNRKRNSNCKLHPGVRKVGERYYVSIMANKVAHPGGGFADYTSACNAADVLRTKLHGEYCRIEV